MGLFSLPPLHGSSHNLVTAAATRLEGWGGAWFWVSVFVSSMQESIVTTHHGLSWFRSGGKGEQFCKGKQSHCKLRHCHHCGWGPYCRLQIDMLPQPH
jgi:hypothetical protein